MKGRDVFVLLPTGGGKSLCYQLPAYCNQGLAVVFSPLLSLIQDQVEAMNHISVTTVHVKGSNSSDYETEIRPIMSQLQRLQPHDDIKMLYVTPEKISRSESLHRILTQVMTHTTTTIPSQPPPPLRHHHLYPHYRRHHHHPITTLHHYTPTTPLPHPYPTNPYSAQQAEVTLSLHHRRGPLHQPVGSRLPARLHGARAATRSLPQRTDHVPHSNG